jgi:hypothetical protein
MLDIIKSIESYDLLSERSKETRIKGEISNLSYLSKGRNERMNGINFCKIGLLPSVDNRKV